MTSTSSKKNPCSFFALGKCRNGSACNFYHAPREDLAVSPLPCKFFLQGACKAGRECKFSHQIAQESQAALQKVSTSTGEKTLLPGCFRIRCKFFDAGGCSVGNKCPYLHEESQEEDQKQTKRSITKKQLYTLNSNVKNPQLDQEVEEEKQQELHDEHVDKDNDEEQEQEEQQQEEEDDDEYYEDQSEQQVTELSDFISKEEELYFYGAPGDFLQDPDIVDDEEEDKPLYSDIARLNLSKDHQEDDHQPFLYHEEKIAKPKQCTFFLQGKCRYGDICFYSHDFDFQEEDLVTKEEEIQQSKELECNICYDFIIEKNERFGLLSGCNHAFCLKCVRDWRGGEKSDQPKQTIRQCPVCRIETHFIIPSSRMITQPDRKQALIDKYVKNLSAIPCRHFDEGRGTCPFGTSCFYAHRYPDGTLEDRRVRTAVDSDGQYDVLRQVRLSHFLETLS